MANSGKYDFVTVKHKEDFDRVFPKMGHILLWKGFQRGHKRRYNYFS